MPFFMAACINFIHQKKDIQMQNLIKSLLFLISLSISFNCFAQTVEKTLLEQKIDSFAAPKSDKTNYQGDRIEFKIVVPVTVIDTSKMPFATSDGCAPAKTEFKGIGKIEITKDNKTAVVNLFRVLKVENDCPTGTAKIKDGDVVAIDATLLAALSPKRLGVTYGTLLVPYKYQYQGDKDFSPAAAIGGYLGYRHETDVMTVQYIGFVGATSVSVNQTVDNVPKTQNMTGISYGVGLLGTVKDSFQLGLIVGADKVNTSAKYRNNGKLWVAVSLGFEFSN
jgi:hypothetical protein